MASWWNLSGGLGYHFLAWSQRHRWRPFREQIKEILASTGPAAGTLVIVGASGGYTLPTAWLRGFEAVQIIDPDPLAPFFFRRQHPGVKFIWNHQNFLVAPDGRWRPEGLAQLRETNPAALFLFANLIGQLPFLITNPRLESDSEWQDWRAQWWSFFSTVRWLSIHDLFSTEREPPHPAALQKQGQTAEVFLRDIYAGQDVSVVDHLTYEFFPPTAQSHRLVWPLTTDRWHIVEIATAR